MSIAILTAADTPSGGLPREVLSQLVQRAALAGKTIAVRHCRNAPDAAQALRHCRRCGSEFVLLDPRHCDGSDGAGLPCIVVNPDPSRPAEASSRSGALSVIDGYGAQGYVLALTLALDYLGCNDWENDVHVGT